MRNVQQENKWKQEIGSRSDAEAQKGVFTLQILKIGMFTAALSYMRFKRSNNISQSLVYQAIKRLTYNIIHPQQGCKGVGER